ncbi:MAG: putative signaling protein [Xylophilus sp.]|nr:MAG: putative signaling protein [Xylophilus sp.]
MRDVLTDANDAAIARTVIALARSLVLGVVVEGVETEGQRAFLAECGCGLDQGYLLGPPVPAEQLRL